MLAITRVSYKKGIGLDGLYFFKINNENTRTISGICSRLITKTTKQCQRLSSGIFIVNFEQISHIVLMFLLLL